MSAISFFLVLLPFPLSIPTSIHALLQTPSLRQYVEDITFQYTTTHKKRCVTNCNDKVDRGLCVQGLFAAHYSEK